METKGRVRERKADLVDRLARTTDEVFSLDELRSRLASGRKLRMKFGADATAPFLHIGHAVNLRMLRAFQEEGHRVQFLIGDVTAGIGDPTGRDDARTVPSREEIERNAREFERQAGRILITDDPAVFETRRNSEWWSRTGSAELLSLLGEVTLSRLSSRDMFRRRVEAGGELRMHELCYPVLQGWDSVMLESDLTIVGTDQLFNEMMGRFFQERRGQRPQVVMTTRITPGLDGVRKQSKSLGNYIGLEEGARDMFGKAMSLPDALIPDWMEVYTEIPMEDVARMRIALEGGRLKPRDAKLALARALVALHHGEAAAAEESEWFVSAFSRREFPTDAPVLALEGATRLDALVARARGSSLAEARRLIAQGAVELDGERQSDPARPVEPRPGGIALRIGKRGRWLLSSRQ